MILIYIAEALLSRALRGMEIGKKRIIWNLPVENDEERQEEERQIDGVIWLDKIDYILNKDQNTEN